MGDTILIQLSILMSNQASKWKLGACKFDQLEKSIF